MESVEQNKLLTQVGKGTPMGELMRRYWLPFAASDELVDEWTSRVRLLGEDLVLFRTRQGQLGLIAEQCPHRRASFAHGIPTHDGIRCPYHGWEYTSVNFVRVQTRGLIGLVDDLAQSRSIDRRFA